MKKLLLLLALFIGAASLTSCEKEQHYSNYSMGANNWIGASDAVYAKAATYLISGGFVTQFQLTGNDNLEQNNKEAITFFDGKLELLKSKGLAEMALHLKGSEGAPFTISFDYLINRSNGNVWVTEKIVTLSVDVEK